MLPTTRPTLECVVVIVVVPVVVDDVSSGATLCDVLSVLAVRNARARVARPPNRVPSNSRTLGRRTTGLWPGDNKHIYDFWYRFISLYVYKRIWN